MDRHGPARLPLRVDGVEHYFRLHLFLDAGKRWVAASLGTIDDGEPVVTRVESACIFGHVFQSSQCDCRDQLQQALVQIAALGRGLILYAVDDDARGMGMAAHFDIYKLRQIDGLDTEDILRTLRAPIDARDHAAPARVLRTLGVSRVYLLSNNAERVRSLQDAGIDVVRAAHEAPVTRFNMTTLHLEKEDLDYGWNFSTHTGFLNTITSEPGSSWLLRQGEIEIARHHATDPWDLDWALPELRGEELGVLYTTDVPPLDTFAAMRMSGVEVVVVATRHINVFTMRTAESLGMRITDWARQGVRDARDQQWEPRAIAPGVGAMYERSGGGGWVFRSFDGDTARVDSWEHTICPSGVELPAPSGLKSDDWFLADEATADQIDLRSTIRPRHE